MRKLFQAVAALPTLLLASAAATAADMPVKAPAMPMPPPFTWSGFYFGGSFGGARVRHNWSDSLFGLNFGDGNNKGVAIGGFQVGLNYQINNFVIGVEGTLHWAATNNNNTTGIVVPVNGGNLIQAISDDTWISTLAARFGWAIDRVLLYGKAGGGWVGNNGFTVTDLTILSSITGSGSNTASGWLLGGGLEWAFAENASMKVEYDYLRLSGRTFTVPVGSLFLAGDTFTTGGNNVQMLMVGLNYRFTWGGYPVMSRY
jgi:outer membrane immunogenic protein